MCDNTLVEQVFLIQMRYKTNYELRKYYLALIEIRNKMDIRD